MRRVPICRLRVIGPNNTFWVYCYGLRAADLMTVPNDYVAQLQRRTGFTAENGYNSSPFFLEDVGTLRVPHGR